MSTPATYSFIGEAPAPVATTLYVHLDGHPQGAANYFRAMLRADEGIRAEAFIRANTRADLVTGPDVWPNTCFRYSLSETHLRAEERLVDYEEGWKTIFDGELVDFINNYPGPTMHRQALYPGGRVGFYTLDQLQGQVRQAFERVTMAGTEAGTPNLAKALRRLAELTAVHLSADRLEEFGESVGA